MSFERTGGMISIGRDASDRLPGEEESPVLTIDLPCREGATNARAYARQLLDARRRRERFLKDLIFGEPEWDIVLDAFVAKQDGNPLPVSSLCVTANVSVSTALRHINAMITGGYLRRYRDIHDQRRSLVEMTEWGEQMVRDCLLQMMARMGCSDRQPSNER